uniref:Uncharacterized protein n=1 Tax=Arundo donax TaxID=35708 RepID=A0A0A9DGJ0_ARUDO
MRSFGLLA